jgi:hypothetical protein
MRYFSTTLIVSEQTTLDPIHHGSLPGVCYGIEEESTVEEETHFGDQHPTGEKDILLWSNNLQVNISPRSLIQFQLFKIHQSYRKDSSTADFYLICDLSI